MCRFSMLFMFISYCFYVYRFHLGDLLIISCVISIAATSEIGMKHKLLSNEENLVIVISMVHGNLKFFLKKVI